MSLNSCYRDKSFFAVCFCPFQPTVLVDYFRRQKNKPKALFVVNLFFAGELFAQAPVEQYPGCVVEAVTDSSRYFVIRIEDGNGKTLSSETQIAAKDNPTFVFFMEKNLYCPLLDVSYCRNGYALCFIM